MPAKLYPFIDIAVHERVREHFVKGDAAVLFSPDMNQVLWSNGEGAFLFGLPSIYDFIDGGANRNDAAYRQMEAAARQLSRSGDKRAFLMRIASGFQRATVHASVEMITVQPGETAILFAAPRTGKPLNLEDRAARMISGFDDPDTHMAVLDGDGTILAASPGFAALSMTPQTCRSLVSAVSRDSDWLLKRPVPTGKGHLPAAIGKLSEDPALHLLFAVETILGNLDPGADFHDAEVAGTTSTGEEPASSKAAALLSSPATVPDDVIDEIEQIEEIAAESDDFIGASGQIETDAETAEQLPELRADEPAVQATPAVAEIGDSLAGTELSETVPDEPASETPKADVETDAVPGGILLGENAGDSAEAAEPVDIVPQGVPGEEPGTADMAQGFVFNPNSRAIRFVWKIDADGRFSEISEEFATAVGPASADVTGLNFTELAGRYHLDPGNTISELLKRRDTWSGKTIYWPVEGTSLQVPVDLAALPTYSRNREFDGFRGFGIVRVADMIDDEQAMGLTFGTQAAAEETVADRMDGAAGDLLPADQEAAAGDAAPNDAIAEDLATAEHNEPAGDQQDVSEFAPEPTASEEDDNNEPPAVPGDGLPAVDEDPFRGELPALKLVPTPGRRASDKIVQLDNHRPPGTEPLSRSEQAAFREIARQLGESFGKRQNEDMPVAEEGPVKDEPAARNPLQDDASAKTEAAGEVGRAGIEAVAEPVTRDVLPEAPAPIVPARTSASSSLTPEILDNLPLALLVHSGDDLFHANSEFLALTGYADIDELREEGGIDALFAGDEDGLPDLPDGAMMLIRNDGQLVPVAARLQSIRWEDKNALMMALSAAQTAPVLPVAEIQPAAAVEEPTEAPEIQALRMEAEELHSILETATDGVVVVGAEGEIRSVNRSASALFNYDDGEIRGKPFAILFAHESQKAVLDYLAGLSGHGVASVLNDGREVIGREASGGFIPLFMTMGRLSSSNGFCAVIRDITQWKRTEEELRNAKRAAETANAHKSDFLARVSHEIRTPLNAIIGFSDMMASEHFGPIGNPRYVEYAGDIGRSGRHVLDIVNDLLDISKIEAGEMDLEFTAVEINDAVSEAVSLVQPQANSQRVIIRTSLSGSVPNVVADNRSIKQIALNILSNAIRFTPSGGQIVVSTAYEANGSVILRIRDTGVGMTRTELEQAMKPFRQVTTGARKRGDGTGLGLPLTKAMAEANRAQFSINSAPNEGTLVEISFPSQRVLAN
ncbi:PAS domain-containing sensor histidine kinase [Pararhizobium sp. YC-54]|uniref:PAS domain-containing sensor histidine kinase n=1 Tax=Pararhizobium sp. YC-54 TaxID=2986920 RepID=UPI0021F7921D|nr:PAS domain-containing sensor histidine kinase [Pararhizobium sp. YC-54]MCV9998683.1 PAS domain-containing sensor histidine kinase [Pararhizobium sp. YC-54]